MDTKLAGVQNTFTVILLVSNRSVNEKLKKIKPVVSKLELDKLGLKSKNAPFQKNTLTGFALKFRTKEFNESFQSCEESPAEKNQDVWNSYFIE